MDQACFPDFPGACVDSRKGFSFLERTAWNSLIGGFFVQKRALPQQHVDLLSIAANGMRPFRGEQSLDHLADLLFKHIAFSM